MGAPEGARDVAVGVVRVLRDAGHAAYLAGGCVRDELLGREPDDYDVATDARPERVRELFRRTAGVGAHFGVVLVRERGVTIEVATFRSDAGYSDRRRPDEVHFSTPEEDARRRDFTVNALFLDPLAGGQGQPTSVGRAETSPRRGGGSAPAGVIDYVGGLDDLRRGVIRAVGEPAHRLSEDHLRALRAVRLACKLSFEIEPATAAAIREHAAELQGVSRERIGDEIRLMLCDESRGRAAAMLQELGLDGPALGDHSDRPPRTLAAIAEASVFATRLAAWAVDRGTTPEDAAIGALVRRWRAALCLSNGERTGLESVLGGLVVLGGTAKGAWPGMSVAEQKRVAASDWFGQALLLVESVNRDRAGRIRARVAELEATPSGLAPVPLVTGEDLIAAGLEPGPAFKRILDRVYDAQLEDRITDRASALAFVQSMDG